MARSPSAARSKSPRSPRPTTRRGRAAHNALSHGLRSHIPIIPGVESEEDWLTHLAGVVQEYAPVGQIETLLVDRIALGFWRLKRVTRYETLLVTHSDPNARPEPYPGEGPSASREDSDDSAPDKEDSDDPDEDGDEVDEWQKFEEERPQHARDLLRRFDAVMYADETQPVDPADALAVIDAIRGRVCGFPLSSFAVPGTRDTPLTTHTVWTGGLVRRTIRAICERFKKDPASELTTAVEFFRDVAERDSLPTSVPSGTTSTVHTLSLLARHPMPPAHILDRLVRYEAHITRDLRQWISDLERSQARRLERQPPPLDPETATSAETPISAKRNGSTR